MVLLLVAVLTGNMLYEMHDVDIMGHAGRIALRVYVPKIPRYQSGAPIVVGVQGGFTPNNFQRAINTYFTLGITFITFLFPGGHDSSSGRFSEGIYDMRGANSLAALYDVLRYAHGDLPDTGGITIDRLSSFPIDTSIIGLIGLSNGGNLTVNVLDIWGDSLSFVDFIVNWESPTSSQIILSELGGRDCDTLRDGNGNGFYDDDRVNPYYSAYGDTSCTVDYSSIGFDTSFPSGAAAFFDGNGNGSLDLTTVPCEWEDINNNGVIDAGEDFRFYSLLYNGRFYYSREVTNALQSVLSPWDSLVATPEMADTFWWMREAVMHFNGAASKIPDLAVILVFSENDHVQATLDKAHIHQAYSGWHRNGIWVRLNPDASYSDLVRPPGPPATPDNPANSEPSSWNNIISWAIPEVYNSPIIATAAVAELCDRKKFNNWADDLTGVLAPSRPVLNFNFGVHIEENPRYFIGSYLNSYANLYQVFAESLAAHGGVLANQFDWVIIEALEHYRPGFLANLESMGHEVTPHGHETVYSLKEIKVLLAEAGILHPDDANGHFMAPYWTDYLSNRANLFHASYNKYVYTSTNPVTRLNPWRPYVDSLSRRWLAHDPSSPVVFVCNYGINGSPVQKELLTDNILLTSLKTDPDRVNARSSFLKEILFRDSIPLLLDSIPGTMRDLDSLVALGIIQWAGMNDIYNQYLSWEASHPGVNPVTDTFTVTPADTTTYALPPGWTFYTEWSDSNAGIPLLPNNVVTSIAIDDSGKVWIGTMGGIAMFDGGVWRWITPHNSSFPGWFVKVIVPSCDAIWVGTDCSGLVKLDYTGRVLDVYDAGSGYLPSNGVHAVYVASDSSVWIGMFHGGVAVLDHGTWRYYDSSSGLPDEDVFAITEVNDTIYVGTSGGGAAYFDGTGFVPLLSIGPHSLGGAYIHALTEHGGKLYAGTFGYGVAKWDSSGWSLIGPDTTSRTVASAILPHGIKFFADTMLVSAYDGGIWKFFGPGITKLEIPGNGDQTTTAFTFAVDTFRSLLWVGTLRGVKTLNMEVGVQEKEKTKELQLVTTYRGVRVLLPDGEIVKIKLFDVNGRRVWETTLVGNGWKNVDLPSQLKSGIYIVKATTPTHHLSAKILRVK